MELNEVTYTVQDTLDAAQLILDQAIIQKNGVDVFEELGFRHTSGMRLYVTDDPWRLVCIVLHIKRDGRMYFLGSPKNPSP
jgi:hypothetical protein